MERLSDIKSSCTWTVSACRGPCVINIIAMFYKSCTVVPIFPPLEANKTQWVSLFHVVMLYNFDIMQFPCCWNDWSDQQNKRTEILQWFRISWTLCDDPQVKLTAINSQSFHSKYPWLLMTIADYLFGYIRKYFNQGRQTSRFLLTGSWQGWLKCWVNYHSK